MAKPGAKRRRPEARQPLAALAAELLAAPRAKANNLPVLLAGLRPGGDEVRGGRQCRSRRLPAAARVLPLARHSAHL